jgi:hypothetical protein
MNKPTDSYLIRTIGLRGLWIRHNDSFADAAKLLHAQGAKKTDRVRLDLVVNDKSAVTDGYGAICYSGANARRIEIGCFTLGHVIRSNGF